MDKRDDTTKPRRDRNRSEQAAAAARPPSALEEAIEAERAQLLRAYAVMKCLSDVLLYAQDEDAVQHAEVANAAAKLVVESVERLDSVRLQPMIEAMRSGRAYERAEEKLVPGFSGKDEVRDTPRAAYWN